MPKSGVIYQFKCPHGNCLEEHIGESGRSFGERIKEHLRTHALYIATATGHPVNLECFTIVDRESWASPGL